MGNMEAHNKRVEAVAERVRYFRKHDVPFRIYHGATNSTRVLKKDADKVVDTSAFNHVLSFVEEELTAIVEPNVAMDALVDALLPHSLIPQVVPEFPGITAGGSYSGTAAESSSFREGYFDRIVNWVEIVLADGTVVRASRTENADLFYGATGALGTLGVVTLLEIKLMRVKEFVELTYVATTSVNETLVKLGSLVEDEDTIFLDAIMFATDAGVVLQARMSDFAIDKPVIRFSCASDPWFFLHVHSKLGHQKPSKCFTCSLLSENQRYEAVTATTELIPIKDYLFRYDRGAFWMGAYGWDVIPLPFNQFGRRLLDSLFKTRTMYSIMHHSGQSQRFVV
jgi:delta24-sterol reductase